MSFLWTEVDTAGAAPLFTRPGLRQRHSRALECCVKKPPPCASAAPTFTKCEFSSRAGRVSVQHGAACTRGVALRLRKGDVVTLVGGLL